MASRLCEFADVSSNDQIWNTACRTHCIRRAFLQCGWECASASDPWWWSSCRTLRRCTGMACLQCGFSCESWGYLFRWSSLSRHGSCRTGACWQCFCRGGLCKMSYPMAEFRDKALVNSSPIYYHWPGCLFISSTPPQPLDSLPSTALGNRCHL